MLLTTYHFTRKSCTSTLSFRAGVMNHILLGGLSSQGCTGLTPAEAAPSPARREVLSLTLLPCSTGEPERSPCCQQKSQCKHVPQDGSPGTNPQMKERKHSLQSPEEQRQEARTSAI